MLKKAETKAKSYYLFTPLTQLYSTLSTTYY